MITQRSSVVVVSVPISTTPGLISIYSQALQINTTFQSQALLDRYQEYQWESTSNRRLGPYVLVMYEASDRLAILFEGTLERSEIIGFFLTQSNGMEG